MTGAQINVSQESLPDSNERTVEIIGSGESCLSTTYQVMGIQLSKTSIVQYIYTYFGGKARTKVWDILLFSFASIGPKR